MPVDPQIARSRLHAERADVAATLARLGASFDDIVAATREANTDDEHDPEGSTIAAERSLVSSLARSAEQRLSEIDAALQRLDAGSYGRCLRCGAEIGEGRLEARPAAERCINCA